MAAASFHIELDQQGRPHIRLHGQWSLRSLENDFAALKTSLAPYFSDPFTSWDLQQVEQLDTAAAAVLWAGWGAKIDNRINLTDEQRKVFDMLGRLDTSIRVRKQPDLMGPLASLGKTTFEFIAHLRDFMQLLGLLFMEIFYVLRRPREFPLREFSANIYKSGVTALPISALLGFMIGIALGYLMSKQLRAFGADIFIVNILGLGIIRELGPMLMAVLVAGRSGSAMTAQIGVMRVTEEIDALTTMGISRILRVVLPKVLGLTFVAPLLVLWTSAWSLLGGAMSANIELGISFRFFFEYLPTVVQPVNLTLSLIKGLLFGFVVTLIACHFGLRVKPNTESLSMSTTSSVVTAITAVILIDAQFAILTRGIGI
ncbi:MAG: ABC transporter permease [Betaproteobacteria bacterium HGW-Betaproteobacteria-1]|jgi:phospholipid/cholesterol/gamma-HCH transport system permease protein|nr:MAG: ABC transporter permease [Betaproteobacteria bacterium HGW-Betaproteobacteria-1]